MLTLEITYFQGPKELTMTAKPLKYLCYSHRSLLTCHIHILDLYFYERLLSKA